MPQNIDYQTPSEPERGDRRWGIASIAFSLAPVFAIVLPDEWRAEVALSCWSIGFILGVFGLWEQDRARKLAFIGVLMNTIGPPILVALYFLFAQFKLARGSGGGHL